MIDVPAGAQACTAHRLHTPANLTVEFHHVIPVAWQLHTPVAQPPFPGLDPDGRGMLWDERGAVLCPTGHRNVHVWIVRLMRAAHDADSEDPTVAYATVRPKGRKPAELPVALEALTRFVAFGSLLGLAAAGEWGEA